MGEVRAEDAESHPMRGRLSRYVGMGGNAQADTCTVNLGSHDRLLLCTDGLTSHLDEKDILHVLADEKRLEDALQALVGMARESGARDNVTVLIAERAPGPEADAPGR